MSNPHLRLKGVHRHYGEGERMVRVLEAADLTVESGELVALAFASVKHQRTRHWALAVGVENLCGGLGTAAFVALLMAVTGTALTGWLQTTDAFWGSEVMEEIHEALATLILVLAALHVAGVVVESLRHRENLVLSMLTGTKRPLAAKDSP